MGKELEALYRLATKNNGNRRSDEEVDKDYKVIENALKDYESIENSNPSEALTEIFNIIYNLDCGTTFEQDKKLNECRETIKQALIKAQELKKTFDDMLVYGAVMSGFDYKGKQFVAMPLEEYDGFMKQEKALEIIKKKKVDMWHLADLLEQTYEMYVAFCKSEKYEEDYILTEEEFSLLKEVEE